jgi:glycosyltransferase involved in cell wall biosynthesis
VSLGRDKKSIYMAMQCDYDLMLRVKISREQLKSRNRKYTFLYLGRIIQLKGIEILIKAFYELRKNRDDVLLLICGDGPFRKHCQNMAEKLGIPSVEFIGPVNHDEVANIYKLADVFVLPTYFCGVMYESWGLVINEALSMSLPVITTTAVGAAFDLIIEGYNGFVVKENDVKDLYEAMNKIIGLDLIKMGKNSRKIFQQKNDFSKMANGFTMAIERELKGSI